MIARREIIITLVYTMVHLMQSLGHYIGYSFLPVSSVKCVSLTLQIVSGIFLLSLFWSENVNFQKIISAGLCIAGIVLIIQPEFLFPYHSETEDNSTNRLTSNNNSSNNGMSSNQTAATNGSLEFLGYGLPALAGFAMGLDVLILKRRPYISEHMIEVLFWSFTVNTLISFSLSLGFEKPIVPRSWYDMALVFTHGISYALMWLVYMFAIKWIEGNTFNLINSTSTIIVLVTQYTLLSKIHPGNKNWFEVVGVALVTVGCALSSIANFFQIRNK